MGRTVLIVDDHPSSAPRAPDVGSGRLTRWSERPRTAPPLWSPPAAASGVGAAATCVTGIDGFEVAKSLLEFDAARRSCSPPSHDSIDLVEAIGASGARGFIPKAS